MITVKTLADSAGISIRTLHYYDQVGLLKPEIRKSNGYRYYDQTAFITLQQILLFREIGFNLEEIKNVLSHPEYNIKEAMICQRAILVKKKEQLNKVIATLDKTMQRLKSDTTMDTKEYYKGFIDAQVERYRDEVRHRWGEKALQESESRISLMGTDRFMEIQAEGGKIFQIIYTNMAEGYQSLFIQERIDAWRQWLENFHHYTDKEILGLGRAYSRNPEFVSFFSQYDTSLPVFLSKAIDYYITHGKRKKVTNQSTHTNR